MIALTAALIACPVVAIYDADGPIWCQGGQKIRLHGIAARELDGSCRPNQPCPPGDPKQARAKVIAVIGGKVSHIAATKHAMLAKPYPVLTCRLTGKSFKRQTAWCSLPDARDLSCEAIRVGAAVRWAKYDGKGKLVRCGG